MKKILLPGAVCILLLNLVFAANNAHNLHMQNKEVNYKADTINTTVLKYHANNVTFSAPPPTVRRLLDSIKMYPLSSYILLTKIDDEAWLLETHPDAAMVSAYKAKTVTVLQGDIQIMGVKYDTERAVILQ